MIRASYIAEVSLWFLLLSGGSWGQEPTPEPSPLPVADIAVTDHAGRPVGEQVGHGKLIVVSSAKAVHAKQPGSLVWLIEPADLQQWQAPGSSDIAIVTGDKPATIRLFQIVALDSKIAWQRVTIRVGDGARPPPEPEPEPEPTPTVEHVSLVVAHDPRVITADTAIVLNASKFWTDLRAAGNDWRFIDVRDDTQVGQNAVIEMNAAKLQPPALIVRDLASGNVLTAVQLPKSTAEIAALVKQYTGGK